METGRRDFLTVAGMGVGLTALSSFPAAGQEKKAASGQPDEEVGATEDLMREHGILNRVLLIYEEGLRRLRDKEDVTPQLFHAAATLVRKFVEDYHEKLEENFIFPEFEKQKKHVELVRVLRAQHEAGRHVTDMVLRHASPDQFRKEDSRREIITACRAFIRMYRPHEAREDTVLFPAFRKLVPARKLQELGEQFEKEEDRLFGEEGFEKTVDQVAAVERQLGIYDLSQFTAK